MYYIILSVYYISSKMSLLVHPDVFGAFTFFKHSKTYVLLLGALLLFFFRAKIGNGFSVFLSHFSVP